MKKVLIIGIASLIIIIAAVISIQNNLVNSNVEEIEYVESNEEIDKLLLEIKQKSETNIYQPQPREWQISGPFSIDRKEYVLGEKIFININGLKVTDQGQIAIVKIFNQTHFKPYIVIPFDGSQKNQINFYAEPSISKNRGICSSEDIVGDWMVIFENTQYMPIFFEINDMVIPGDEEKFSRIVC